jgi:hypothetical protein
MKVNKTVKIGLLVVAPAIFFLVFPFFHDKRYTEHSLERSELCYQQITDQRPPTSVCSHIAWAADQAYFAATSFSSNLIIPLLTLMIALGVQVVRLDEKVKELQSKLDV